MSLRACATAMAMAILVSIPVVAQDILNNIAGLPEQQAIKDPVSLNATYALSPGADTVTIELTLTMLPRVHIYAAESLFFKIEQTRALGLGPSSIELPAAKRHRDFDGTMAEVFEDGQKIVIRRPITDTTWALHGQVRYQACDNRMCFMPTTKAFAVSSDGSAKAAVVETAGGGSTAQDWEDLAADFEIAGALGGYAGSERFLAFLNNPGRGSSERFAGRAFWVVVILVLVGGIALNLTPCVLPIIPITLAVIGAGARAGSRARGFAIGTFYGLGMTLAYGVAGAAVVVTGVSFGIINSSPVFNILIAIIFSVLALAMFDIIHIDFTKYRSGMQGPGATGGNILTAFGMGMLTALLAGACVAPVVISVIVYSADLYADGTTAGLLLPFLLGAGMALPWPLAGAGLSFLPKPGGWMVWVRNLFGAVILAIALWYGYTGVRMFLESRAPEIDETALEQSSDLAWTHSLADGLEQALSGDMPVLLDFWATWCKNCKAMDATTFRDAAVKARLEDFVLVKVQAEKPDEPETKNMFNRFGVVGLPTYVVLSPK